MEANQKERAMMKNDVALLERPKPAPNAGMMDRAVMTTYRDACAEAGIVNPSIVIEDFRYWLNDADLPAFDLGAVSTYMDALTAADNPSKMGWEWLPARASDRIEYKFGRPAIEDRSAQTMAALVQFQEAMARAAAQMSAPRGGFFRGVGSQRPAAPKIEMPPAAITPASDYYAGIEAKVYDRTIPIHALKKIARIEREFGAGKVVFMITDYVTQPHVVINPDPFLMAVVPNKDVGKGVGRFVIDVWDEPGFGIAQMLK